MNFQVGDRVKIEGILEKYHNSDFPLKLKLAGNSHSLFFTNDGKFYLYDENASIELVERPKPKVKKYLVLTQHRDGEFGISNSKYSSKEDFEKRNTGYKFIQLIQESESEVTE